MMPKDCYSEKYEDTPHLVYRMLDENGVPLYIGCTVNLEARLKEHGPRMLGDLTVEVTTEPHPTRSAGLAAEREAIRAECPVFNSEHNSMFLRAARAMYAEMHGVPPRNAPYSRMPPGRFFYEFMREHHAELVRRVYQLRGHPLPESEAA